MLGSAGAASGRFAVRRSESEDARQKGEQAMGEKLLTTDPESGHG